jgi:hypothetical protein
VFYTGLVVPCVIVDKVVLLSNALDNLVGMSEFLPSHWLALEIAEKYALGRIQRNFSFETT